MELGLDYLSAVRYAGMTCVQNEHSGEMFQPGVGAAAAAFELEVEIAAIAALVGLAQFVWCQCRQILLARAVAAFALRLLA